MSSAGRELHVDDQVVADGPMIAQPGFFTVAGEGLCVGRHGGDSVSSLYKPPSAFTGGTITQIQFNVSGGAGADLEREARAAFARD